MTEEQVTKAILKWLLSAHWEIVCFDFPQSGTGKILHPNHASGEKNKDSIIPDIVAVQGEVCVFFENKDRFYLPDYEKVHHLINSGDYSQAISQLLANYPVSRIFYGIGLPASKHGERSKKSQHLVDFIVGVRDDKRVDVLYSVQSIFGPEWPQAI